MARRPKWIGAFLLSLAVAAIFALLGQWQLDRSFTKNQENITGVAKVDEVTVGFDSSNFYVIANRIQGDVRGYWVISNSTTQAGKSLTIAHGWTSSLKQALAVRSEFMNSAHVAMLITVKGSYLPSEAPLPIDEKNPFVLQSLSLAQLVNLYSPDKPLVSENRFFALQTTDLTLDPIEIRYQTGFAQVNWLSAFYALEWAVFAGFAVFLWWRLVKDAIIAETLN